MNDMLKTAFAAADAGAKIAFSYWRKDIAIEKKADPRDLVTIADKKADAAIKQTIQDVYPDHYVLSEEGDTEIRDVEWMWVIDPIDGTTNFTMGQQNFGISIGLLHNGKPYLGVIDFPALGERCWAVTGEGAFRKDHLGPDAEKQIPLQVSKTDVLTHARYSFGYYPEDTSVDRFLEWLPRLVKSTQATRINYCFVYDAMNVARGGMDFYLNLDNKIWDMAASWCIVQEAGGEMVNLDGKPITMRDTDFLVTNGKMTNAVLNILHP